MLCPPDANFLNFIITVPGGDILFDSSKGLYAYQGKLYNSGDQVVEVFCNGDQRTTGDDGLTLEIK